jgi:hypothetical protein
MAKLVQRQSGEVAGTDGGDVEASAEELGRAGLR